MPTDASNTGLLVNTVTVTAANDTNPANDTATDTDTLTAQVDVGVTKDDFTTTAVPGTTTTYTFIVTTTTPISTLSLHDALPISVGVTGATWTGSNGSAGTGALID